MGNTAYFRFYEELNDFLPEAQRKQTLRYEFLGRPTIGHTLRELDVPESAVDLIVMRGRSIGLHTRLRDRDRVAVYPMFESFDIKPIVRLRKQPLRDLKFIAQDSLAELTRYLRLCGFDAQLAVASASCDFIEAGQLENRVLLCRDRCILDHANVTHGYWVREERPELQVEEVLRRFDLLRQIRPQWRCGGCNGLIQRRTRAKEAVEKASKASLCSASMVRCGECGNWSSGRQEFDRLLKFLKLPVHSRQPE